MAEFPKENSEGYMAVNFDHFQPSDWDLGFKLAAAVK
jgi:hypothetical protein